MWLIDTLHAFPLFQTKIVTSCNKKEEVVWSSRVSNDSKSKDGANRIYIFFTSREIFPCTSFLLSLLRIFCAKVMESAAKLFEII